MQAALPRMVAKNIPIPKESVFCMEDMLKQPYAEQEDFQDVIATGMVEVSWFR